MKKFWNAHKRKIWVLLIFLATCCGSTSKQVNYPQQSRVVKEVATEVEVPTEPQPFVRQRKVLRCDECNYGDVPTHTTTKKTIKVRVKIRQRKVLRLRLRFVKKPFFSTTYHK